MCFLCKLLLSTCTDILKSFQAQGGTLLVHFPGGRPFDRSLMHDDHHTLAAMSKLLYHHIMLQFTINVVSINTIYDNHESSKHVCNVLVLFGLDL